MTKQSISIFKFANHFGFIWLNGDRNAMKRQITERSINRPGLELAGYFNYSLAKRLIFIGNKEHAYISEMKEADLKKAIDFLMTEECPGIVICRGNPCPPIILELAKKKNFPLFMTNRRTSELMIDSVRYLDEVLSPHSSIHGTLIEVFSMGVVLIGESGIGKSETALELIKKGHRLVSDDRVDVTYVRGQLIGKTPDLLINMMEVRGVGIIDISKMFGINTIINNHQIDLVIKLVPLTPEINMERLGNKTQYYDLLDQKVPMLTIPVSGARSVGDIIEVAVTNFKLKKLGYDSTYEFEERLNELLRKDK
jgi:HPr kinase/phosphorylase